MISKASKLTLAAAAALCLPAAAQAGTSTDTKTASFTVVNQCSITGATIDLGTYTTQQTWGDLAATIGHLNIAGSVYTAGSRGEALMKIGSITCDNNVPYGFDIRGSSNDIQADKAIELTINGKTGRILIYAKKLGAAVISDEFIPGRGASLGWDFFYGSGTGSAQDIQGSVLLYSTDSTTAQLSDKFGTPGTYADTLTYVLNF
ncbi:hypothetical protein ACQKOE_05470 [Novosphingobium sp. NPDC080210]|uniref:hypothetical protein n=1 Tax=Novosphingobium sp. NPDC080210 TaxID=3390596 RepID=UPI003D072CC7